MSTANYSRAIPIIPWNYPKKVTKTIKKGSPVVGKKIVMLGHDNLSLAIATIPHGIYATESDPFKSVKQWCFFDDFIKSDTHPIPWEKDHEVEVDDWTSTAPTTKVDISLALTNNTIVIGWYDSDYGQFYRDNSTETDTINVTDQVMAWASVNDVMNTVLHPNAYKNVTTTTTNLIVK